MGEGSRPWHGHTQKVGSTSGFEDRHVWKVTEWGRWVGMLSQWSEEAAHMCIQ